MRISAVMQAHNSCCATGDTNYLANISYVFQQQEERVCRKSIIQARKSVRRNK